MFDASSIVTAVITSGALGTAGKFAWNKIEKRFDHVEAQLEICRASERASAARSLRKLDIIEWLCEEVGRLSPVKPNPTLRRVKSALQQLRHPDPNPEIDAIVRQLEERDGV